MPLHTRPPLEDAAHGRAPTEGRAPLEGIRVVECGSLIAGPFCGQLLGDFGAEVIKVEDPGGGDPMRQWGQAKPKGISLHWPIVARNKKSITLDLRRREGQAVLMALATKADMVVENFRPGTLEGWGLGFEELTAKNPGLILVRVSGYGQTGPYSSRPGFGAIGEAMGGLRYLCGEPDRPPSRIGISMGDSLAAIFAALGAILALRDRDVSGRGQVVDAAIYEAVLAMMESLVPEWELAAYRRERTGPVLPGVAPSNSYPTADGCDVLMAANRDTVFRRLAHAMGRPDLADDPRYSTHDARSDRQQELDELISAWTRQWESDALLEVLHAAAIPAGRVFRAEDMLDDPHFLARDALIRLVHPILGSFPMQNVVPRLSRTPGRVVDIGPDLGYHNAEIYRGLLGFNADDLERLRQLGVI